MSSTVSMKDFLSHVPPFQTLPPKELESLVSMAQEKSYGKGETIFAEGDAADSVWILREGRIQIFKYTSSGRPLAIESLGPEELFGTLCRLGGTGRNYPCTATTSTACAVIRIFDKTFLDFYNRFPALVMGVCTLCSQRLNEMQGISCAGQEPVDKRIATVLLQLQKSHGDVLPITKREIAELAGTTVETTIRTVSGFSKKGWVSSARGKITLKQPKMIGELRDAVC